MVGDWNGDGYYTIGIFRSTGIYAEWHLRNFNSAGGPSITPLNFGVISDKPITGDYN